MPEFTHRFSRRAETGARHVNDGLLRLLAILAQTKTDHSALLFDEIENGINPELVEALVNMLLSSRKQIFVTTHSPMVLNYLADEEAKGSVIFMYRNHRGYSRAKRFFDVQEAGEKLALLGPGEVFIDTDLVRISEMLGEEEDRQR
ncbi:MAG: AAA family ATPase [Rectinemataceae bacterium]